MRRLKADGTPSKVVELPPIHDIHRGLVGETPEECMATRERWIDYSALDAKVWGSVGRCEASGARCSDPLLRPLIILLCAACVTLIA